MVYQESQNSHSHNIEGMYGQKTKRHEPSFIPGKPAKSQHKRNKEHHHRKSVAALNDLDFGNRINEHPLFRQRCRVFGTCTVPYRTQRPCRVLTQPFGHGIHIGTRLTEIALVNQTQQRIRYHKDPQKLQSWPELLPQGLGRLGLHG